MAVWREIDEDRKLVRIVVLDANPTSKPSTQFSGSHGYAGKRPTTLQWRGHLQSAVKKEDLVEMFRGEAVQMEVLYMFNQKSHLGKSIRMDDVVPKLTKPDITNLTKELEDILIETIDHAVCRHKEWKIAHRGPSGAVATIRVVEPADMMKDIQTALDTVNGLLSSLG